MKWKAWDQGCQTRGIYHWIALSGSSISVGESVKAWKKTGKKTGVSVNMNLMQSEIRRNKRRLCSLRKHRPVWITHTHLFESIKSINDTFHLALFGVWGGPCPQSNSKIIVSLSKTNSNGKLVLSYLVDIYSCFDHFCKHSGSLLLLPLWHFLCNLMLAKDNIYDILEQQYRITAWSPALV